MVSTKNFQEKFIFKFLRNVFENPRFKKYLNLIKEMSIVQVLNQVQIRTSNKIDLNKTKELYKANFEFLRNFQFKPLGSTNYSNSPEKISFLRKHK